MPFYISLANMLLNGYSLFIPYQSSRMFVSTHEIKSVYISFREKMESADLKLKSYNLSRIDNQSYEGAYL